MSMHPTPSRPRAARLAAPLAVAAGLVLGGCVTPAATVYHDPYPMASPGAVYVEPHVVAPAPIWVEPYYYPNYYPTYPAYQPRPVRPAPPRHVTQPRPPHHAQPRPDRHPPATRPQPRPPRGDWQQGPRPDRGQPGYQQPRPGYQQPRPGIAHPSVAPRPHLPVPMRAPRDTGENSGP